MNKTVVGGYKIYTSVLYSNWFAVEYIEQRGSKLFRVRVPYNTLVRAMQMRDYMAGRGGTPVVPDYQPHIHIMEKGIVR